MKWFWFFSVRQFLDFWKPVVRFYSTIGKEWVFLNFLWFLVIWIFHKINIILEKEYYVFRSNQFSFLRWASRFNATAFSSMNQFYVDFMIKIRRSKKLWIVRRTSLRCKSTNFMIICFLSCSPILSAHGKDNRERPNDPHHFVKKNSIIFRLYPVSCSNCVI